MTDKKAINELKRRQKAIGVAISALQEREERSKGCELCHTMNELRPCPFCGGEAQLKTQEVDYGLCGAWVYCTNCQAKTNYMNTHEMVIHKSSISTPMTDESRAKGIAQAIEAWNRRADNGKAD